MEKDPKDKVEKLKDQDVGKVDGGRVRPAYYCPKCSRQMWGAYSCPGCGWKRPS